MFKNILNFFTKKYKKKNSGTRKNRIDAPIQTKIFTLNGSFKYSKMKYKGKFFFRKMTNDVLEKKIALIVKNNPHPNIVTIYRVGENYIDMELLNDSLGRFYSKNKICSIMLPVKKYLQDLGIIYIDWKLDNIGLSQSNILKLFDFDASGLINPLTGKWECKPPEWYAYRDAVTNGMKTPIEIDNFSFDKEFN